VAVFLFAPPGQDQDWQPPADVYQTSWGWILKFELAGVRMDDLNVHVSKRAVTVSGIRRDYMIESGCSHYSMEITYSRFKRSIELPDDLTGAHMRLDYRDGILFVRIRNREKEEEDCK
jgi:HSP20 family protein